MNDYVDNSGTPSDDMSEYLQTFLDETEEQLDDLVETMLALEKDAANQEDLNEAFRLIHSIKGSAGMMGFDSITVLTHRLEHRFECFRSGVEQLDERTMNLVLRCVDFLRQCNSQLRRGEPLGAAADLLDELARLEERSQEQHAQSTEQAAIAATEPSRAASETASPPPVEDLPVDPSLTRILVRFRHGLPLVDLKAQLIASRLSKLGDVKSTHPDIEQLVEDRPLDQFEIRLVTSADREALRLAADVDGVESLDFPGSPTKSAAPRPVEDAAGDDVDEKPATVGPAGAEENAPALASDLPASSEVSPRDAEGESNRLEPATSLDTRASDSHGEIRTPTKVGETMRVDIERLDHLMNLAGELVTNRARLVRVSSQISPALRSTKTLSRIRESSDGLRQAIESMEVDSANAAGRIAEIQQLRTGLELLEEHAANWDNERQFFGQISEAIDQLSRVSHNLQQGVLDTRMVSVAPLFNRFKRVVRDLSKERGKQVNLQIRGEKTELDKRMIDELGDPLVHLVRNSLDHGLEPPDVRVARGKPPGGSIVLEASHNGNNVYIRVHDDGGGISIDRIKARLIENQILAEADVAKLSSEQALEYIWHPGFSTAKEVTDISGRGVGMDVVKTRIDRLNGTISVDSKPRVGTTFTLRLPLTLAIINCLLVRLRNILFALPMDDVREIVSIGRSNVVTVRGKQAFDVRGEFIPLVSIDDVFQWHDVDYGHGSSEQENAEALDSQGVDVVIVRAAGRTMGLCVNELLGSQDIVVKSLSDNFIDIRGLSGASILGDGTVCLMLDVGAAIGMAVGASQTSETEETTS